MSMVALKIVQLALRVICIHQVFPVVDLMTSSFLTEYSGFATGWSLQPMVICSELSIPAHYPHRL